MTDTDKSAEAETLAKHLETLVYKGVGEGAPMVVRTLLSERNHYKARAERAESGLTDVKRAVSYPVSTDILNCGYDLRTPSINLMKYIYETTEAVLTQIETPRKTVSDMVSREDWQEMDERDSNPNVSEPRQPTVKPLEWEDFETESLSSCGSYRVYLLDSGVGGIFRVIRASFGTQYLSDHRDATDLSNARAAAKAAAQADYERRILSALAEGDNQ